jgi:serine/threonine protein kinase
LLDEVSFSPQDRSSMRALIVDELSVTASPEQAAAARELAARPGNFAAHLLAAGFAPRDVLQACCAATGLPPAPQAWLRAPKPPTVAGLDEALCRRHGAAPIAIQQGRLCIVYSDPEVAARSAELGFPRHQAYLALPADVLRALAALPTNDVDIDVATRVDPIQAPPLTGGGGPQTRALAGSPSAEEADLFEDGSTTVQLASAGLAPGDTVVSAPAHVDDSIDASEEEDEDLGVATAPHASPPLPTAPKPPPRAAVTVQASKRVAMADASAAGKNDERTTRAQPSLATPHSLGPASSPGVTGPPATDPEDERSEHRSLRSADGLSGTSTRRIAPARHLASALPDGRGPATADKPDDAATMQMPPPRTDPTKSSPTLSDNPSLDTQQQALAILSQDDLIDDSGDDPPVATPENPAARDVTRYQEEESGAGAFASARSAEDQKVVQQQKQRLKRIAQIASIKRYKIERILGRGGMATVYFAIDTKTGTSCALKLMEPHLADDAVFVERFKREIRACTALSHENIVGVFDYGEEGGTYYMASEYVDGGTVASLLRDLERPVPVALAVPLMMGFLDGLQHAHEQGFVHRDLKPANLMLTSAGVLKIGDFGIAKAQTDSTLTKTGALFGTPAYMSPEQAQGQDLDARSDLFGVGIIFYELLAGYNPYAHDNPSTTMFAIAKGQARALFDSNPTVPECVERVITKLLERDRAKRYQSAGEARADLLPMHDLLRSQHPGVLARALNDLDPVVDALLRAQGELESKRAAALLKRSMPEHAEAAFRYYKATLLDPQNADAVNGLAQLRADYGFRFTRPEDKQIAELEQSLEKKAEQPAVLRRLADLSATHRNLVDMAGFMKRYLRLMPGDTHVQHKLGRVLGTDPFAPFSPVPVEIDTTQAYAATEELAEAARNAGAEEPEPATRGVRPAAKVRAAAQPGRAPPPAARRDGVPASSEGASSARAAIGGAAPTVALPPAAAVAAEPSPPRDSLEALVQLLRGFLEDTVRSLTGDQGISAVKEAMADRLGEGRGEIKDAVRGALGKGKDAVAEGLLKKEGREAIGQVVRGAFRRHWRLAALIVFSWVLLLGLGKACSLAFASGDAVRAPAPEATKPRAAARAPAALLEAPEVPAPAVAPPPEQAPADDPPPPAESAADPSTVSPPPPPSSTAPSVALDGKDGLSQRQEELKRRAAGEPDAGRAIELYTEAIDIDPYGASARGALLARARLHLAGGALDLVEANPFRLKRRPDYHLAQADAEAMNDEIARARRGRPAAR